MEHGFVKNFKKDSLMKKNILGNTTDSLKAEYLNTYIDPCSIKGDPF